MDQPSVAAQMADMLARAGSGHSPTSEEIRGVEGLPGLTDAKVAKALEPLMQRALASPDAALRGYGLAMLVGMQSLPEAMPAADPSPAPDAGASPAGPPATSAIAANGVKNSSLTATAGPAAYKGDVGKALAPLVPAIGRELADDDPENRLLAATALGGFALDPPAAVYSVLLGFLKRDDAVGSVGLAVVGDLLQIGPVNDDTAAAIAKYLHRSDQTADAEASLVEAIASKPNQSRLVNKSVLGYLASDDASLRSRVILSLPALDLSAQSFADAKAKVEGIAMGGQESLEVVNAARAVVGCWTQVKMTEGCPVYR